jgi:hypothetical protein
MGRKPPVSPWQEWVESATNSATNLSMKTLTALWQSVIAVSVASSASSTVPQAPFAAGPSASVSKAVGKAHQCGISAVRVERSPDADRASAFWAQAVPRSDEMCVMHWMTKHGRELKFDPRWYRDDFSKDWPD